MSPHVKGSPWGVMLAMKNGVNARRVNKECHRQKIADATFISVPRLVRKDGSFALPKQVLSKTV
jgi:hypothetical protein